MAHGCLAVLCLAVPGLALFIVHTGSLTLRCTEGLTPYSVQQELSSRGRVYSVQCTAGRQNRFSRPTAAAAVKGVV